MEKTFDTIQKMYESVGNPDTATQKLYKTQAKALQKLKDELTEAKQVIPFGTSRQPVVKQLFENRDRVPNLNRLILRQIEKLGLTFTNEKQTSKDTFDPIHILDYIYAVLHRQHTERNTKNF